MRTPNTECDVCGKPLYRRPSDLAKYNAVCCKGCRSELYKKREPSPNLILGREKGTNHLKGIPKTENHKNKMKKIMTKWCKDNPDKVRERAELTREENHYNWKGGVTIINQSLRRMTEYIKWQRAVKKRDGYCMICTSRKELETHHIIPLVVIIDTFNITNRDEARECDKLWDLSNGITMCQECHCKIHNRKYTKKGNGRRNKNDNN